MSVAFLYGADAVYGGLKSFSLREQADNFSLEELRSAAAKARGQGKKFYLAANIFFHDRHLEDFKNFLKEAAPLPVDGWILSDPGVMAWFREKYPDARVHVSTQANTVNSESVKFYRKLGVQRVVLARELTLDEIRAIRDNCPDVELEAFVHGAMCIAYSGRCLLSNYMTHAGLGARMLGRARDANLGDCSQSCRWEYALVESTRPGECLPIEEGKFGTAILSSRDLNMAAHLRELLSAGVNAFKIEGRVKSAYYAAAVTRVYRRALDLALEGRTPGPELLVELEKVAHREYTTGFYFGDQNSSLSATGRASPLRDYLFLAVVTEKTGPGRARLKAMNRVLDNMDMELITPGFERDAAVRGAKLILDGKETARVQPNSIFEMEFRNWDPRAGDILRARDFSGDGPPDARDGGLLGRPPYAL